MIRNSCDRYEEFFVIALIQLARRFRSTLAVGKAALPILFSVAAQDYHVAQKPSNRAGV